MSIPPTFGWGAAPVSCLPAARGGQRFTAAEMIHYSCLRKGGQALKIVMISNYFNHHQRPLCDALSQKCEAFSFISTGEMREERKALGYSFDEPDYVLRAHDENRKKRASALIAQADVVIYGSVLGILSESRLYRGKTVLYYSERLYKKKVRRWLLPLRTVKYFFTRQWRQNSCLLCASAYAPYDYSLSLTLRDRYFQWGYFPQKRQYDLQELLARKDKRKLLWCGRLIEWKHPELAITTAHILRNEGYDFTMDIIGSGAMQSALSQMISELHLNDCVRLLGSMLPQETREHMERAGIFLFTSDRQEGWGAVLNEAMNSACAVVASHAAGSVPWLVSNGENGFIFESGDSAALLEKVRLLLERPQLQNNVGASAYETIMQTWNADVAADRLTAFAERACGNRAFSSDYPSGPLSKARIIDDNWFKDA